MAIKNNRTCLVDGKKYSYCPSCSQDKNKPAYMATFCSENCMKLFMAASDYAANEISKEDAKKIVDKADLSNRKNFKASINKFIAEILGEKIVPEKKVEKTEKKEIEAPEVKADAEPEK